MKIFTKQGQLTFDEMTGALRRLPKGNRWVHEIIKENPCICMQYMCSREEYSSEALFDPSLFVTIRKRISIRDINEMTVAMVKKQADQRGTIRRTPRRIGFLNFH